MKGIQGIIAVSIILGVSGSVIPISRTSYAGDPCVVPGPPEENLGLYAPNPENCSEFLVCDNGEFRAMPCPPGLHWNAEEYACDFPENANCFDTPDDPEDITTTPETSDPDTTVSITSPPITTPVTDTTVGVTDPPITTPVLDTTVDGTNPPVTTPVLDTTVDGTNPPVTSPVPDTTVGVTDPPITSPVPDTTVGVTDPPITSPVPDTTVGVTDPPITSPVPDTTVGVTDPPITSPVPDTTVSVTNPPLTTPVPETTVSLTNPPVTSPVPETTADTTVNPNDPWKPPQNYTSCPPVDPLEYTIHLPHPNCTLYYMCDNGVTRERPCPAGLHWNLELWTCDWPASANCVDGAAPEQPNAVPLPSEFQQRIPSIGFGARRH